MVKLNKLDQTNTEKNHQKTTAKTQNYLYLDIKVRIQT